MFGFTTAALPGFIVAVWAGPIPASCIQAPTSAGCFSMKARFSAGTARARAGGISLPCFLIPDAAAAWSSAT